MMKTATRFVLAAAAASMAVLPVAAQANTRAGDSGVVHSASAPGLGRAAAGERQGAEEGFSPILLGLISAGLVITGIVLATQSNDKGQSPGT
ncbi:MAG: hypothetical protein ACXIUO_09495 [Erythrobacter sp.]